MNKQDLIEFVANKGLANTKADAERVVEGIFSQIKSTVASGQRVSIGGFGIFEKQTRKARTGRNPRTGENVQIPAMGVAKFRPAKAFKDAVK